MSDLKTQLIRLGNARPDLREHIKPVIAHLSSRRFASDMMPGDVSAFLRKIEGLYHKHLNGEFLIKAETNHSQPNNIYMRFTLLPKVEWTNGIMNNDPSLHKIFLWNSWDEGGLNESMELNLSQGGSVSSPDFRDKTKLGWRNARSIAPSRLLSKLDRYFAKMAQTGLEMGYPV